MRKTAYDMLYLTACAINKIKPDVERAKKTDLEKLFRLSGYNSLTALVAAALESAGIYDKKFMESKARAIRKIMLLDAERGQICGFLERNGIWYMSLKGVVLKDFYSEIGMRQMSDNDILFDKKYRGVVTEFMRKRGYILEKGGGSHCDEWLKEPVYNFEMHLNLFVKRRGDFYKYYKNLKERLIKVDGKNYGYKFTDEDFYIYMTAHAYKHYSTGGTGLRSLLDYYVYLKNKEELLDWGYIAEELGKLGISKFEKEMRETSKKAFVPDHELTEKERETVEFMIFSGAYGTMSNSIKRRTEILNADSKGKYIFRRIFPNMEFYRIWFPTAARYPVLIPFVWIYRMINAATKSGRYISEMRNVKKMKVNEFSERAADSEPTFNRK